MFHFSPIQVLVIHYESIQSDTAGSLRTLLRFLGLPVDEARIACVDRHHSGFFKRRRRDEPEVIAFKKQLRSQVIPSFQSELSKDLPHWIYQRGILAFSKALKETNLCRATSRLY